MKDFFEIVPLIFIDQFRYLQKHTICRKNVIDVVRNVDTETTGKDYGGRCNVSKRKKITNVPKIFRNIFH